MLLIAGLDEEGARATAALDRTRVTRLDDADDLQRLLAAGAQAYDAIILGTRLDDPMVALHRIKQRAPDVPILILVPPDRCARLQHELLLAPLPGEAPRCVPLGEGAPAAIEAHLTQGKLRRRHRAALERANQETTSQLQMRPRLPPMAERFFDAAPIGIVLVHRDGRVIHRNRLARELTPPDEGAPTLEAALPGAVPLEIRELLERPEARPKVRLCLTPPTGGARHFDATTAPLDVEGAGAIVLVTLDEVTRLVETQRRLEEARAAAAAVDKLATMGSLVGGLAHEIRTPMTAILNNVVMIEMLARRATREDTPRDALARLPEHAQEVAAAVERVQRLIKDLNRFMRGEQPERSRTTLSDAVEDAARLFEAAHRGRTRLVTRLDSRALIFADSAQVQQIALNLLQNAAEASPSGVTIRLETRDAPDAAELVVADEGAGIPEHVRARIFEPFVTTKPDGTGLGLSIVRRLAELHGASIRFDSGSTGTTFVASFPRVE